MDGNAEEVIIKNNIYGNKIKIFVNLLIRKATTALLTSEKLKY